MSHWACLYTPIVPRTQERQGDLEFKASLAKANTTKTKEAIYHSRLVICCFEMACYVAQDVVELIILLPPLVNASIVGVCHHTQQPS